MINNYDKTNNNKHLESKALGKYIVLHVYTEDTVLFSEYQANAIARWEKNLWGTEIIPFQFGELMIRSCFIEV